jgi:hypothetical protein
VRAEADERVVDIEPGHLVRGAIAGEALAGRPERAGVGDVGDPLVAVREEVLHCLPRAADVVEQHRVGLDVARRAVEEDDRRARRGVLQPDVLAAGGHDQQRVDAPAQQRG